MPWCCGLRSYTRPKVRMAELPCCARWLRCRSASGFRVRAIGSDANGMFEVAGPVAISLRDYQRQWRQWLRISDSRVIQIPQSLASAQVYMADVLSRGPMSATIWRMLRRGNVTAPDAFARIADAFGYSPRSLEEVLSQHPSQVQYRWHARLYFLAPLLRVALTALWVISGVAGLLAPADGISYAVFCLKKKIQLARIAG